MAEDAGHFLNAQYWNQRYQEGNIPWNTGTVTPALINYLSDFPRDTSILIPGVGTSREGITLANMGFTNITFNDYSTHALDKLQTALEEEGFEHVFRYIGGDFFELQGAYDIIMEQTFFCALDPSLRQRMVEKVADLLRPEGIWFGVLFRTEFDRLGPPFGGSEEIYKELFTKIMYIEEMTICQDSIPARDGNELFFICKKVVNG